jgi:hypothetical protein
MISFPDDAKRVRAYPSKPVAESFARTVRRHPSLRALIDAPAVLRLGRGSARVFANPVQIADRSATPVAYVQAA